jgi:hypothetical protein
MVTVLANVDENRYRQPPWQEQFSFVPCWRRCPDVGAA